MIWTRSPIPIKVRYEVMQRARGCCEDCGMRGRLELHHLTYRHTGHKGDDGPIFGRETAADLAALCRNCHYERHLWQGHFCADIDEREDMASAEVYAWRASAR